MRVDCWLRRSSSATSTSSSVAIWSMNAPVPPAQLPFMRSSMPPVARSKKMILASSPPSSTTTLVSGASARTSSPTTNTSCWKGRPAASARPMPAEPEMAARKRPSLRERSKVGKHFQYLLPRLRIVALIALVEDVPAFHQRQFDRRGTDIDPQRANGLFLHLFHSDLAFAPAVPAKMNTYIYSTVYYTTEMLSVR